MGWVVGVLGVGVSGDLLWFYVSDLVWLGVVFCGSVCCVSAVLVFVLCAYFGVRILLL